MERLRSSLTEEPRAVYLRPYVIVTPCRRVKVYGSRYIVLERLISSTNAEQYLAAPYVTLTIPSDNLRSFTWFWYYLNGLAPLEGRDPYWDKLTFDDRLSIWEYIKHYDPNDILRDWYVNHLFDDITPSPEMKSYLLILDDIRKTTPLALRIAGEYPGDRKGELPSNIGSFDRSMAVIMEGHVGASLGLTSITPADAFMNSASVIINSRYYSRTRVGRPVREEVDGIAFSRMIRLGTKLKLLFSRINQAWYILGTAPNGGVVRVLDVAFYRYDRRIMYSGISSYPTKSEVGDYILSSSFPFTVGGIVIHGDLLTMRSRSRLFSRLMEDGELEGMINRGYPFPSLLEEQKFGSSAEFNSFLYVWKYLNGIQEKDRKVNGTMWKYISYFEIPLDSPFVNDFVHILLSDIETKEEYEEAVAIVRSIPPIIRMGYKVMHVKGSTVLADSLLAIASDKLDMEPTTVNPLYHDYVKVPRSDRKQKDTAILTTADKKGNAVIFESKIREDGGFESWPRQMEKDIGRGDFFRYRKKIWMLINAWGVCVRNVKVSFMRKREPRRFEYKNMLRREYDTIDRKISGITFPLSMKTHKHTLSFPSLITEKEAVTAAEEYMSLPVDKEYYRIVRTPYPSHSAPWDVVSNVYIIRGDFLENEMVVRITNTDGVLEIEIGRFNAFSIHR